MTLRPKDSHSSRTGDAPTPFSASEIRHGCPQGRLIRLRVTRPSGESMIREIRFVEVDEEAATQEARNYGPDGSALGEPTMSVETWRGFQSHASFPLTGTTIVNERLETALGQLHCVRYTVVNGATIEIYWFALDLPGMPVRVESHVDGRLRSTMEMIENVMPQVTPGPAQ